jgi:hypothetical protein
VNGDKVISVNVIHSNLKLDVGGKQEKQLLAARTKGKSAALWYLSISLKHRVKRTKQAVRSVVGE